jgi:hypothetical protein
MAEAVASMRSYGAWLLDLQDVTMAEAHRSGACRMKRWLKRIAPISLLSRCRCCRGR